MRSRTSLWAGWRALWRSVSCGARFNMKAARSIRTFHFKLAHYMHEPARVNGCSSEIAAYSRFSAHRKSLAKPFPPLADRKRLVYGPRHLKDPLVTKRRGEVPEWSNGAVSKTVERASVPRVRIPLSPPFFVGHPVRPRLIDDRSQGQRLLGLQTLGMCA